MEYNIASDLTCKTIARIALFLQEKNPNDNFPEAMRAVQKYYDNAIEGRFANDKLHYKMIPAELEEKFADNEAVYSLIVDMFNKSYLSGYMAGMKDTENLLHTCERN